MTGKELYDMWKDAMSDENVGADDFEDLSDQDKSAWGAVGRKVELQ